MRPFTSAEKTDVKPVITIVSEDTVAVDPPEGTRSGERAGTYKFSKVHGQDATQAEFYDCVLKPVVDKAVANGRNGLLFAYGEWKLIAIAG